MGKRSELCHTSIDNGLGLLFELHQREATRRVLTGEASQGEFSVTRTRLDRWCAVRRDAESNLRAFEEDYTPFIRGLEALHHVLPPDKWAKLAACHRARVCELLHIDIFVAEARSAISAFEHGLRAVGDNMMTLEQLSRLHAELVDAYRIS